MITSITREFDLSPNIVGINTTDNLATITTQGYFFGTQGATIEKLTNGVWKWDPGDMILMYYAVNQIGFFVYNPGTDAFVAAPPGGGISSTLPEANIIVGNASNIATAVTMTGDATITSAGVLNITPQSIVYNLLAPNVGQLNTINLSSAQLNALYTTPVLMVGPPGVGRLTLIDKVVIDYHWTTSNTSGGGNIATQYGNAAQGAGVISSQLIAAATINGLGAPSVLTAGPSQVAAVDTSLYNTAMYMSCDTAPFTGGGGGATVYVFYKIITPA